MESGFNAGSYIAGLPDVASGCGRQHHRDAATPRGDGLVGWGCAVRAENDASAASETETSEQNSA